MVLEEEFLRGETLEHVSCLHTVLACIGMRPPINALRNFSKYWRRAAFPTFSSVCDAMCELQIKHIH